MTMVRSHKGPINIWQNLPKVPIDVPEKGVTMKTFSTSTEKELLALQGAGGALVDTFTEKEISDAIAADRDRRWDEPLVVGFLERKF